MVHDWMDPEKRSAINAKVEAEAQAEAERAEAWRSVTFSEHVAGYLALGARLAFLLGVGAGLWTLGWDILRWLRFGVWSPTELLEVFVMTNLPIPSTSWVGVDKIVDQVVGMPVAVVAPVLGVFLFFGLGLMAYRLESYAK